MITDVTGGYLCILFYVLRFAVGMMALVTFLLCLQNNKRGDTFYISILALVTCILIPEDLLVLAPKEEPDFPRRALIPIGPRKPHPDVVAWMEKKKKVEAYLKRQEEIREYKANDPAWQEYYRKIEAAKRAAPARSRGYSSSSGSSSWPTRRDDDDRQEWTPVMNMGTGKFDMVHRDGYSIPQY